MVFQALDILGTIAFAISGVMTALNKRLDPFGIFIIAFVTAVGGGTLRDVLIGQTPVSWMEDLTVVYVISASVIFAVLLRKKLSYLSKSLFLFDTIGLGVFTLIGIEKGIASGLSPIISIALGAMTGTFGGVIRDILCNEIPVIFRKEVYAMACVAGGFSFFLLKELPIAENLVYILTALIVITIRILAVIFHLQLPSFYRNTQNKS
ncbi:trimeric intracellular cation channel family protein [Sungkyunkwania multivorans]|uniref:Trimeric intracellular cation channel family protein n=1 Tax=Sungkyunkwania multivorans TaxID=1173618 RepID=A0ABW3CUI7_9FLAO